MSEQSEIKVNPVHTSCRDCVFATYAGKTQTGCSFGNRVEKFDAQGAVLPAYDHQKEFFIINGRKCSAFRSPTWAAGQNPDGLVAAARRALTVRTDIIIPFDVITDDDSLKLTLDNLKWLLLKPSSVHVISNQDAVKISRLHAFLAKQAGELPWSITNVVEREADNGRVSRGRAIDIVARNLKGHFYTVVQPGSTLPSIFTLDLDRAVTDELARFSVLTPNSQGEGLTVALGFHNAAAVQGNKPMPSTAFLDDEQLLCAAPAVMLESVAAKAAFIAEYHGIAHMVGRVEDVCPRLA